MPKQHPTITFEQASRVDRIAIDECHMTGLMLMENAGAAAARWLASELASTKTNEASTSRRVIVLCGKGNNGGDGYVIARHLQLHGLEVAILATEKPDRLSDDASVNAKICQATGIDIRLVKSISVNEARGMLGGTLAIVDALLGTGVKGGLRSPMKELVRAANGAETLRVAIDVPTGWPAVNASDDEAEIAFRADHTLTFVARKRGMECDHADSWIGQVHALSIGAPRSVLERVGAPVVKPS